MIVYERLILLFILKKRYFVLLPSYLCCYHSTSYFSISSATSSIIFLSSYFVIFIFSSNYTENLLLNSHSFHLNKFALFEFSGFEKREEKKKILKFPFIFLFSLIFIFLFWRKLKNRAKSDFARHGIFLADFCSSGRMR